MRIAMVGSRGIPAREGGVEHVVAELARELVGRGHEVLVYGRRAYVCGLPEPQAGTSILTGGVGGKHLETITHTATAMLDALRREVDVVHVHSPGPALLSWLGRLGGVGVVLTVHAPDWRRQKWSSPARLALGCGLRVGMRAADAVTSVSAPLAEELSTRFGREVHYVPNAARPAGDVAVDRIARWQLEPDRYGLYVGRIVPEKRLDLLISVWADVPSAWPLVVVGNWRSSRYGRACRAAAGANVRFVDSQHGPALAALYAGAAMVVQPSALEGMSLVLLEAASHGRCILAAEIPANRHAMADAIAYFRPDDRSNLVELVCRYLDRTGLRERLGRRARDRVEACYSWAGAAERMEQIYVGLRR